MKKISLYRLAATWGNLSVQLVYVRCSGQQFTVVWLASGTSSLFCEYRSYRYLSSRGKLGCDWQLNRPIANRLMKPNPPMIKRVYIYGCSWSMDRCAERNGLMFWLTCGRTNRSLLYLDQSNQHLPRSFCGLVGWRDWPLTILLSTFISGIRQIDFIHVFQWTSLNLVHFFQINCCCFYVQCSVYDVTWRWHTPSG